MKNNAMRRVMRSPRAGACTERAREYIKLALDSATAAQVMALARESRCTPFAMCVGLLEESLSRREPAS